MGWGLLALASCKDSTGPITPPDVTPPGLEVISPVFGRYDRDGDGLIEVEVAFTDAASGVDPQTIRLTAGGRDLLAVWSVLQRDASGLEVEETVEGLLPAGPAVLELSVSDIAGNLREASRSLDLPAAALHHSIPLPFDPLRRIQDVAMRPDGEVLFAVDETSELLLVDPDEYRLIAQPSGPLSDLQGVEFDALHNRVYAVSFLHPGLAEFEGTTGQFLRLIPTTQGAFALALSRLTSEVYIPLEIEFEEMNGILSVVSRDAGEEVALIQSGIKDVQGDGSILGQHSAVLTEDEQRLYVPTVDNGLLVYDPHGRGFLEQIDLRANDERLGTTPALERVDGDLYVNVFRGSDIGAAVYRLDASTGTVVRIKELGPGTDINTGAAASPDGTQLFVSGAGGREHLGLPNYLLSLPGLDVFRLEGLQDANDLFAYKGAAWHPDGRRIYVAAGDIRGGDNAIVVYLVRP